MLVSQGQMTSRRMASLDEIVGSFALALIGLQFVAMDLIANVPDSHPDEAAGNAFRFA